MKAILSRVTDRGSEDEDGEGAQISFHWACCAPNAALEVIGSQKAVHYRGERGNKTEKGWKENVSFFAPLLCPSTIMVQELIKRAVDASVFVINLTFALIKFVMTAGLVPVCHQTHNGGVRGAVNVRDSSSQQISQWSTANIHRNPSIKSPGDGVVA